MEHLKRLDNIDKKVFQKLFLKYKNDKNIRIIDSLNDRGYFLISNEGVFVKDGFFEYSGTSYKHYDFIFTFIWIDNNLWQYKYMNVNCKSKGVWKDPLELINELLR